MKKRLRKKKHKKEFKEYGFEIQVRFKPETSNATHNQCFDELIEFLEQKQLMYGGSIFEGFITAAKGSVTDFHEQEIRDWMKVKNNIIHSFVLTQKDAWYP